MDTSTTAPRRALVVDDEQPLARLVASYLEREGFEVDLAFDGPSAVGKARERDPELIVLDLGLPGLDGVEVCRQVRTFSDAYVIVLWAIHLSGLVQVSSSPRPVSAGLVQGRRVPTATRRGRGHGLGPGIGDQIAVAHRLVGHSQLEDAEEDHAAAA